MSLPAFTPGETQEGAFWALVGFQAVTLGDTLGACILESDEPPNSDAW